MITAEVDIAGSQLWSDSAAAYRGIGPTMNEHHTVDHSVGEYVRAGAGTNLAEGYFSQLKRSIDGTHHHVSVEHLDRYLSQFDFMYTHCKATDSDRLRTVVGRADRRRLTYKPLTEI